MQEISLLAEQFSTLDWIQAGNPMTALTGTPQDGPLVKMDIY